MHGKIHIYTGNGKGKTTASIGLSIRAAGSGKKVLIVHFMKEKESSEHNILKKIDLIDYFHFGKEGFILGSPSQSDISIAKKGFRKCADGLTSGAYDLVIIDEIINALYCGIFTEKEVLGLLNSKRDDVEVALTGRNATKALIEKADLVSKIVEIKHYYNSNVQAREGIEF